jgi:hypothetical protein
MTDYIELCKLHDTNENSTMMLAELENILTNNLGYEKEPNFSPLNKPKLGHFNTGDTIPKDDTKQILKELADQVDEDGFFPYTSFDDGLCGKA